MSANTSDLKSFNFLENGTIVFSEFDTIKNSRVLDPGYYKISWLRYPKDRIELQVHENTESVKTHSFPEMEKIENLLAAFTDENKSTIIKKLGFDHKIGFLFHGKGGCGKTSIMRRYYSKLVTENNAIVFHLNIYEDHVKDGIEFIQKIRHIQKNLIVVVLDEFDNYLSTKEGLAVMKRFLDGDMSIDGMVMMASTNYIDQIPEEIRTRPSRFKLVTNVESIQDRKEVYSIMCRLLKPHFEDKNISIWSKELVGHTVDSVKQFCLDKIMEVPITEIPKKTTIGFVTNSAN